MTILKYELQLLTDMMALLAKYVDGFIFIDDYSDDGSYEFYKKILKNIIYQI
jgi:hypothetical protein